jgi:hypothetical protein
MLAKELYAIRDSHGVVHLDVMRSRPEKKSQPSASTERRVLPMQLQIGDRLADEAGDREVIG